MSDILKGLKPERVFYYFEQICRIPHGSHHMKAISDYCLSVGKKLGLESYQDDALNVIIRKKASPGYEQAPVVMLQGHMDMVCEKNRDVDFDFEKDSLKLVVDGDVLRADGTTLGGDDGAAVAMILAILEDGTLEHPELEAVFTTDEEVGMDGAKALDTSRLKASYLLNLDHEDEGHLLVSCAGGLKGQADFQLKYIPWEGLPFEVRITGLKGGHSGADIHLGRANANRLMGRILLELNKRMNVGICHLEGGMKDNAIPREAFFEGLIRKEDQELFRMILEKTEADIQNEYRTSDGEIRIQFLVADLVVSGNIIHPAVMEKLLFMLVQAPDGIQTMSMDLPGLPESSLNMGVVAMDSATVTFLWAVRSSVKSLKHWISDKLQYMTEFLGGDYSVSGSYPEWAYKKDSPLRHLVAECYKEQYGQEPVVESIHAGLECGLILEKMPDLDIVALGADVKDIHTPDERLSISSMERTYRLLIHILSKIK